MKVTIILLFALFTGQLVLAQEEKDVNHFSVKIGYQHVQHIEPSISGSNLSNNNTGFIGGNVTGLNDMNGLNLKLHYFFNNHFGLYGDFEFASSDNEVNYQNDSLPTYVHSTHADFMSQSIGVAGRFSQEGSPFNAYIGSSVGHYGYTYSLTSTANDNGLWYDGSHHILKFGIDGMIDFEIIKGFNIFTSINYSTQLWVDGDGFDISYTSDNGDYYSMTINSPSMAAIRFTFGLGYNF